ncbi:MAG: hypothetical protein KJO84_03335 [Acidimicrobiia bacterium]|nr:hypothetical protein [Acidimicrobiia bacterium]
MNGPADTRPEPRPPLQVVWSRPEHGEMTWQDVIRELVSDPAPRRPDEAA